MDVLLALPLPTARCRESEAQAIEPMLLPLLFLLLLLPDPRLGCCCPAILPEVAADLDQVGKDEQEHNAGDPERIAWKLYITDTSTSRSR